MNMARAPLSFEANRGQAPALYGFVAHGPSYALGISSTGLTLELHRPLNDEQTPLPNRMPPADSSRLQLRLTGTNGQAALSGLDEQPGRSNYFIGNDPSKWQRSVPHFARVRVAGAYPGIDLVLHGNGQQLEYDFAVAPGANPDVIGLTANGVERVALDADGNALLRTSAGDVELMRPVAWQEVNGVRESVESRFLLGKEHKLGFSLGKYDRTRALVIDPVLLYSVSLGGSNENIAMGMAFDANGYTYLTGHTCSADFPVTAGSYQNFTNDPNSRSCDQAFLIKMDPTASTLLFSDFIGGNGVSSGGHVAVDSAGNIYLAGATGATNFATVGNIGPTAPAPCGLSKPGFNCAQGFILKLSPDGSQLLFSSLLGGGQASGAYQVKLNPVSGDVDVLGETNSSNFEPAPTTLETTFGGGSCSGSNPCFNAFLLGLDPATGKLRYGTFLGGPSNVLASGLAFDASGNIYVAGSESGSLSSSLGSVTNTYPPAGGTAASGVSLFVAKLNLSGTTLTPGYLTIVQADGDTGVGGIAVDKSGNLYFGGATSAQHLPVTTAVFQSTNKATMGNSCNWGVMTPFLPAACGTGLVGKLNSAGALSFLTYLGGTGQDMVEAVGVDSTSNIWLTGVTFSYDFPYSADAYKLNQVGEIPFLAEMSNDGTKLPFATELAGDLGQSTDLQIDSSDNIYVAGTGVQPPSTPGTYPPNPGAYGSAYLEKWNAGPQPSLTILPTLFISFDNTPQGTASAPQTLTIQNTGAGPMSLGLLLLPSYGTNNVSDFLMTTTCGSTLAAGASCNLVITFAPGPPTCVAGPNCLPSNRTAQIVVNENAPQGPQIISLTGTATVGAAISAVPNPVVFPAQAPGTSSAQVLDEIGSDGDTALKISNLVLGGANASDFQMTTAGLGGNDCAITALAPGSLCYVGLTFSPPASATGTRTATLTLTDNAPDSPQTVNITATVAGSNALNISPLTLPIGPVVIGTNTWASVMLQNPSPTTSIQVASLGLSGTNMGDFTAAPSNCSSPSLPVTIAAGASCYVKVTFNPAAGASGQRTATLTVGTTPANAGLPTVSLIGDAVTNTQPGMTTLEVPSPMNFGGVQVGQSSNGSSVLFTVFNNIPVCGGGTTNCGAPLTINAIVPGLTDYTVTGEGGALNPCSTFPVTIAAGANCTYTVTFTPTQAGSRNTTLTIQSNDPQGPVQLPVYGTGLTVPLGEFLQSALNFGNSAIGIASPPLTTTLMNTGQSALNLAAVTASANFAVSANTCSGSLAPNATCTISLTFTPPAAGNFTGTLTITDNDAIDPQQTVNLTGSGASGPQLRIVPATLNFGNQAENTLSAPQTITITSTGDATVTLPAHAITSSADFLLQSNSCGTSLAFGASCTLSVAFKPTTTQLPEVGTLLISDNATGNPQPIYMMGTGVTGTATPTTTAVTSSANPSQSGQSVAFTVTVTSASGTNIVPTGTVTLMDGTTTLGTTALNAGAQATFVTSSLSVGSHSITALYGGDSNYAASTSTVLAQVVNSGTGLTGTTTTVASSANPAIAGQSVTFTATVKAGTGSTATPTGTVTFMDGTTTLGTGTLNGSAQAAYSTSSLTVASHSITAVYAGDANFSGSTSSVLTQVINGVTLTASTTTLASSANPSASGQSVTFTATVAGPSGTSPVPTGAVTFLDGTTTLGTGTLNSSAQATYSTSTLTTGSHSITAQYGGDTNYSASTSSALSQIVGSPSFSLSASPATVTVAAGKSGTTLIAVTPAGGFSQQVSFACSGLPAASTCSFSPSTLTPNGTAAATTTLTVATDVSTAVMTQPDFGRHNGPARAPTTFLAVVLLGLGGVVRTRRRWSSLLCVMLLVTGLGLAMTGCGGSSSKGGGTGGGGGGSTTPTGSSTVTVTATAGTLSQTTTFTLTVQ